MNWYVTHTCASVCEGGQWATTVEQVRGDVKSNSALLWSNVGTTRRDTCVVSEMRFLQKHQVKPVVRDENEHTDQVPTEKTRQEAARRHLYSFCLLFYLDEWNTFSYKNDLKWTTLYNEQAVIFLPFFCGFQDKYTKRLICYHKGERAGEGRGGRQKGEGKRGWDCSQDGRHKGGECANIPAHTHTFTHTKQGNKLTVVTGGIKATCTRKLANSTLQLTVRLLCRGFLLSREQEIFYHTHPS